MDSGLDTNSLHECLEPWQWPKDKVKAKVCQVFNEKREASSKEHVKAGAHQSCCLFIKCFGISWKALWQDLAN